ncbi:MAG: DUF4376 domain-containing protein [Gammaproteobacteria bacterium]
MLVRALEDESLYQRAVPDDHVANAGEVVVDEVPEGAVLVDGVLRMPNADELRERARVAQLAALKTLRDTIIFSEFEFNGHWIDCDRPSRANLMDFQTSLNSGVEPFPFEWRTADNEWVSILDVDAWANLMGKLDAHVKAAWLMYRLHEGTLKAHPDPANYDIRAAIDTASWPAQRVPA